MLDTDDLMINIQIMLEKTDKQKYITLKYLLSLRNFKAEDEEDIRYMHKIYKKHYKKMLEE